MSLTRTFNAIFVLFALPVVGARTVAAQLTISGRVVDSTGAAIQGVQVFLVGLGVGTQTDISGDYSFEVVRANGQTAALRTRLMGFGARVDTVTLSGTALRHDVTLRPPIYAVTAKWVLEFERGMEAAAGLKELETEAHDLGEREIRIRHSGGMIGPYNMYRLVNRSGRITGEHLRYWHTRDGKDSTSGSAVNARAERKSCERVVHGEFYVCRTRFTHAPNWRALWKSLDSLGVWDIVDEGTLGRRKVMHLDGDGWTTAETWDGHSFRSWSYSEDPGPVGDVARVNFIKALMERIDSLTVP